MLHCTSNRRAHFETRSGKVIVLVAVSLTALMGATGLVIDGGRLMAEHRHAQNAADSAALAAAIDLYNGASTSTAKATALTYASRNGYTNTGTNPVTVNIPPSSGPNAGNSKFVEVIASRRVDTSFMQFLYSSATDVKSRGVAGYGQGAPSDRAVIALKNNAKISKKSKKSKKSASVLTGLEVKKATLTVDGPIRVNSSSKTKAAVASDGAKVTATSIKVNGGFSEQSGGDFTPDPTTGVAPQDDPLGLVPAPSTSGMANRGSVSASSGTVTLQPGLYSKIQVTGSANVTLQPGIYVVQGGEFKIETNGNLSGDGVMIYNATDKFSVKVNGTFSLSAPTSGDYKGLTLFQARSNTKTAKIDLKSNSDLVSGTYYVPNGKLEIKGKGKLDGAQLIASRVLISGDETINLKFDASKVANANFISLVE